MEIVLQLIQSLHEDSSVAVKYLEMAEDEQVEMLFDQFQSKESSIQKSDIVAVLMCAERTRSRIAIKALHDMQRKVLEKHEATYCVSEIKMGYYACLDKGRGCEKEMSELGKEMDRLLEMIIDYAVDGTESDMNVLECIMELVPALLDMKEELGRLSVQTSEVSGVMKQLLQLCQKGNTVCIGLRLALDGMHMVPEDYEDIQRYVKENAMQYTTQQCVHVVAACAELYQKTQDEAWVDTIWSILRRIAPARWPRIAIATAMDDVNIVRVLFNALNDNQEDAYQVTDVMLLLELYANVQAARPTPFCMQPKSSGNVTKDMVAKCFYKYFNILARKVQMDTNQMAKNDDARANVAILVQQVLFSNQSSVCKISRVDTWIDLTILWLRTATRDIKNAIQSIVTVFREVSTCRMEVLQQSMHGVTTKFFENFMCLLRAIVSQCTNEMAEHSDAIVHWITQTFDLNCHFQETVVCFLPLAGISTAFSDFTIVLCRKLIGTGGTNIVRAVEILSSLLEFATRDCIQKEVLECMSNALQMELSNSCEILEHVLVSIARGRSRTSWLPTCNLRCLHDALALCFGSILNLQNKCSKDQPTIEKFIQARSADSGSIAMVLECMILLEDYCSQHGLDELPAVGHEVYHAVHTWISDSCPMNFNVNQTNAKDKVSNVETPRIDLGCVLTTYAELLCFGLNVSENTQMKTSKLSSVKLYQSISIFEILLSLIKKFSGNSKMKSRICFNPSILLAMLEKSTELTATNTKHSTTTTGMQVFMVKCLREQIDRNLLHKVVFSDQIIDLTSVCLRVSGKCYSSMMNVKEVENTSICETSKEGLLKFYASLPKEWQNAVDIVKIIQPEVTANTVRNAVVVCTELLIVALQKSLRRSGDEDTLTILHSSVSCSLYASPTEVTPSNILNHLATQLLSYFSAQMVNGGSATSIQSLVTSTAKILEAIDFCQVKPLEQIRKLVYDIMCTHVITSCTLVRQLIHVILRWSRNSKEDDLSTCWHYVCCLLQSCFSDAFTETACLVDGIEAFHSSIGIPSDTDFASLILSTPDIKLSLILSCVEFGSRQIVKMDYTNERTWLPNIIFQNVLLNSFMECESSWVSNAAYQKVFSFVAQTLRKMSIAIRAAAKKPLQPPIISHICSVRHILALCNTGMKFAAAFDRKRGIECKLSPMLRRAEALVVSIFKFIVKLEAVDHISIANREALQVLKNQIPKFSVAVRARKSIKLKHIASLTTKRSSSKRLRSRNLYIDQCLYDENSGDNYADLEDFIDDAA